MSDQQSQDTFEIFPIGHVRRGDGKTVLEIMAPYRPALKELDRFSHVQVCWWFNQFDDEMYRGIMQSDHTPYEAPTMGVFACRSPVRPNPIALTTAEVRSIDHERGVVEIVNIDAFDGTPVLDLKPYIPSCDRVKDVRVAEWAVEWPQWLPAEGVELAEGE